MENKFDIKIDQSMIHYYGESTKPGYYYYYDNGIFIYFSGSSHVGSTLIGPFSEKEMLDIVKEIKSNSNNKSVAFRNKLIKGCVYFYVSNVESIPIGKPFIATGAEITVYNTIGPFRYTRNDLQKIMEIFEKQKNIPYLLNNAVEIQHLKERCGEAMLLVESAEYKLARALEENARLRASLEQLESYVQKRKIIPICEEWLVIGCAKSGKHEHYDF